MDPGLERYNAKLEVMVKFAKEIAWLSKCRRLNVGAVIVDHGLRDILAFGYNGPASGRDNSSCRDVTGSCGCIHAEANALLKLDDKTTPCYIITTHSPCELCAGLILNSSNITDVISIHPYRVPSIIPVTYFGDHYEIIERRKIMYDARRSAMFAEEPASIPRL
jgi:deoxycytidylate deaminase